MTSTGNQFVIDFDYYYTTQQFVLTTENDILSISGFFEIDLKIPVNDKTYMIKYIFQELDKKNVTFIDIINVFNYLKQIEPIVELKMLRFDNFGTILYCLNDKLFYVEDKYQANIQDIGVMIFNRDNLPDSFCLYAKVAYYIN